MIKFNKFYKMYNEVYLNEPFGDKYDLNKIINWSSNFLKAIAGTERGYSNYTPAGVGSHDRKINPKAKKRYDYGVKLYQDMMPLTLQAINELYEIDYKLFLLNTQYSLYKDKFNLNRITQSLIKMCDFLKEFILTSIVSKWCLWSEVPEGVNARDYLYNIHLYNRVSRMDNMPLKPIFRDRDRIQHYKDNSLSDEEIRQHEKEMEEDPMNRKVYIYFSSIIATLKKKLESNNLNDKIIGVTMLLNAVHDDDRGLVIAQPGVGEEYPELLIPLDRYEKASRINKNKIERELKQEIFGY